MQAMILYDANFILQAQHTHLYTSISIVPLMKNPSFGLIFETLFFLPTLLFQEGERREKRSTEKVRVWKRERERTFCYGKIGGNGRNEEVFILTKKGNMSVYEAASGLSQWTWLGQVQGPEKSKWTWWRQQGPDERKA